MSERLVVIDGKSVFYRGFYAMPNLATKDGRPTGGVYGFAVMALEVIKRLKPNYVCVAWDKRHTNIRARLALYPQYKAGRKPAPEGFYEQVEILHELLAALGWPLYELDDYEADDLMATFATQAKAKDVETYLVTSDLDVLQLVNSHTHIFTLKKGLSSIELFNEAHFEEKYGVGAHQWVDVKALKGDASDNIPGVAGIGEKTALELIDKYQDLDGVYAHLDALKPALKAKLEKDRDMAYLSKKLVTLYTDAPMELEWDKARLKDGVTPEFVALLRQLEFRALLRQVESAMTAETLAETEAPAHRLQAAKQSDSLKPAPGQPRVVALNPEATEIWLSVKAGEYAAMPLKEAAELLHGPVVGHNLRELYHALLAANIAIAKVEPAHDTRLAAFILDSLTRSLELSDLCEQTIALDDAGHTIAAIWQLYEQQRQQLEQTPTLQKIAHEVDFPSVPLLATIEHRGILLDTAALHAMSTDFEHKITTTEKEIYELAGQDFNISSPAQLGMILYEKLGLPTQGVKKGKTGYSTGVTELNKLRPLHPIIDKITEYREYTKLKSTYIDTLPQQVDVHGRLHTTFAQDVAATGRLSSRDPNLQNIPTRTELGQAIRSAFVPAPGNMFVSADYSQFELRLAACMANDRQMVADFNKDDSDIHAATAAQVYGVPLSMVTKEMRRRAKAVNFGILYGMSPHGLSVATGMSPAEARKFIDKYFELRASLQTYMTETAQKGLEQGYVETMFGRRRPTPDMKSANWIVREAAKRAAINMPIQGTEADLMKMAMLQVEQALGNGELGQQILQIHDSILVETSAANAQKVADILKQTMEHVYKLPVKLAVDVKIGKDWGEL